ncbi:histidine phosphatase family protein [Thalassiella azotivora]
MSAERVVLWRHGRTASNAGGRWQGQLDVPVDDVGRDQAARAAGVLAGLPPTRVVSSDLSRAADTAQALADATGLQVELDKALREVHAGRWEGLTRAEIDERWPGDLDAWLAGQDVPLGGGERRSEVAARAAEAIERYATSTPEGVLVVASHGGALRDATARLLGLPFGSWAVFAGLRNCHWGVLTHGRRGWSVDAWNVGA